MKRKVKVLVPQLGLILWPHGPYPTRLLCPWNSPGKNTGMSSLSLIQGIFPTQGSNPGLLHCRRILYQLSHQGSPINNKGTFKREREGEKKKDSKQKIKTPKALYCLPQITPEKQSHRRLLCPHCGVRTPKTTVEEAAAWISATFWVSSLG